jgi:predicted nucleic acid-binding Zn finger protein
VVFFLNRNFCSCQIFSILSINLSQRSVVCHEVMNVVLDVNVQKNQSQAYDKGWFSSLGVRCRANSPAA